MDPNLQLRYLDAMGVQAWRVRDGAAGPAARHAHPGGDGDAPGQGAGGLPAEGRRRGDGATAAAPRGEGVPPLVEGSDWGSLREAVVSCRACSLCESRTQTVFGVGDPNADLMIVGEAPGFEEDRRGEPFVGRAGRLLDLMLEAIGLDRSRVYIANILKCRPPGNRDPQPSEAAACRGYLTRQIQLVRPRLLLSVGRVSAQNLLGTDAAVGRLRGRWLELEPWRIPLRVTYHPSYLLRSPEQKAKAWQDLVEVAGRLRAEGPGPGRDPA